MIAIEKNTGRPTSRVDSRTVSRTPERSRGSTPRCSTNRKAFSVTTIPASAYVGVSVGNLDLQAAGGAAVVLGVNVAMLLISGTLTLLVQRFLATRHPGL